MASQQSGNLLKALGPGILFAGAAIGVSHLVQSTRSGAIYGLTLLPLIILVHLLKLPAMLAGPRYAAATGTSLLEAYRRQGRYTLAIFAVIVTGTAVAIVAAISMVTAAIFKAAVLVPVFGATEAELAWVCVGLLGVGACILATGGFAWLDRVMKALMVVMLVTTMVAAGAVLPRIDFSISLEWPSGVTGAASMVFIVALIGWMPAPLDITVWNSLWTIARSKRTGTSPTARVCRAEFLIGFGLCLLLACAFAVLGSVVMRQNGVEPSPSPAAFVAQLFSLYESVFGPWITPVIGASALAVMFSTLLTVLDALPRSIVVLVARLGGPERPWDEGATRDLSRTKGYWIAMAVIVLGAMLLVGRFRGSMTGLVDLATTLSFLGTPLLAWFNHRAMTAPEVPEAFRPGGLTRAVSLAGVVFFAAFALLYLWTRSAL